jgi:uncharacterized protein YkwD
MKRMPQSLVLIVLLGTATSVPAAGQKAEKLRVSDPVTVKATANKVASGFNVTKGEWLELEIKGKWRMSDKLEHTQEEGHTNLRKINDYGYLGALIYQIGAGKITAAGRLPFQADATGQVYFGPNRAGWTNLPADGELVIVLRAGEALKAKRDKALKEGQNDVARLQGDAQIKEALAVLNQARKDCGLEPVTLSPTLSKGCALHAHYLVVNRGHPRTQGLGGHKEYEDLKGYTPEGARAGQRANVSFGAGPPGAVRMWLASLYHRTPLLHPSLRVVGIGADRDGWYQVSALECLSGMTGKLTKGVVYYPDDKQKDVERVMAPELPRPLPEEHKGVPGFPITASFVAFQKVRQVEMTLKDSNGAVIKAYLSTPEKPATAFPQSNVVCLIPDRPLAKGATYQVELRCQVNGAALQRTWSFTTAAR